MLATASSPELPQSLKQVSSLSFAIPEGALPPALFHRFVVLISQSRGDHSLRVFGELVATCSMGRARARVVFESFNKRLVFSFFGEEFACGAYSQVLRLRLMQLIGNDYPLLQGTASIEIESPKIGRVNWQLAVTGWQNSQLMIANFQYKLVEIPQVFILACGGSPTNEQMQKEMAFMAGKVEGLETALTKQQNINVHSNLTANAQAQSLSQAQVASPDPTQSNTSTELEEQSRFFALCI